MSLVESALNFFSQSAIVIAFLFLAIVLYLYFKQNDIIYPTSVNGLRYASDNPYPYQNPSQHNLKYENLYITTSDKIKLHGWIVFGERVKKRTLIYFQENAGNIGFRLPFINFLVTRLNVHCIIIGYRGYGKSEGKPSEAGLKLDGEAVVNYIFQKKDKILEELIDIQNVYVFGRSLGGAVAAHVAAKNIYPLRGIIIENTFSSMGDMVDKFYPFMYYLREFLLKNKWETKKIIGNIKYPVMFFKSEYDEMVGTEQMNLLIKLAEKCILKDEYMIKKGTHIDGYVQDVDGYIKAFLNFFKKVENIPDFKLETKEAYENSINISELKKNN